MPPVPTSTSSSPHFITLSSSPGHLHSLSTYLWSIFYSLCFAQKSFLRDEINYQYMNRWLFKQFLSKYSKKITQIGNRDINDRVHVPETQDVADPGLPAVTDHYQEEVVPVLTWVITLTLWCVLIGQYPGVWWLWHPDMGTHQEHLRGQPINKICEGTHHYLERRKKQDLQWWFC